MLKKKYKVNFASRFIALLLVLFLSLGLVTACSPDAGQARVDNTTFTNNVTERSTTEISEDDTKSTTKSITTFTETSEQDSDETTVQAEIETNSSAKGSIKCSSTKNSSIASTEASSSREEKSTQIEKSTKTTSSKTTTERKTKNSKTTTKRTTTSSTTSSTTADDGKITVYLTVNCLNAVKADIPGAAAYAPDGKMLEQKKLSLDAGSTAFDALKASDFVINAKDNTFFGGVYVVSIQGISESKKGGWLYSVNEVFPNKSCSLVEVKEGDHVSFDYTVKPGDVPGSPY